MLSAVHELNLKTRNTKLFIWLLPKNLPTTAPRVGESLYTIMSYLGMGGEGWMFDTPPNKQIFDFGV